MKKLNYTYALFLSVYILFQTFGIVNAKPIRVTDLETIIAGNVSVIGDELGMRYDQSIIANVSYLDYDKNIVANKNDKKLKGLHVSNYSGYEQTNSFFGHNKSQKFSSITSTNFTNVASSDTSDGSVDLDFDPGSGANRFVHSMCLQNDGKILLVGNFTSINGISRSYIARLNSDGSLDTDFKTSSNNLVESLIVQNDGKILLVGSFGSINEIGRSRIARLNSDGSLDMDFNPSADNTVFAANVQSDGKIVLGGFFTSINGVSRKGIARLNSDGSIDMGFDPGSGVNNDTHVYTLSVLNDSKILLVGTFSSINGVSRKGIARLNSDGSIDMGFNPGLGADKWITELDVQSDGKIILGGEFTKINGISRNNIARLNADGSVDMGFNPDANNNVTALCIQSDGKINVGGFFTNINGISRNGIARLNVDGSVDLDFDPGTGTNGVVSTMIIQRDGKLVLGGDFTNVNEVSRNRIARLHNSIKPLTKMESPSFTAKDGDIITIPIGVSVKDMYDVTSIQFKLAKTINGASISITNAFMPQDWLLEMNDEGDYISYAAAGSEPFMGDMTVLEVNLSVNTEVDVQTQLMITDVVFNENFSIPVELGMLNFEGSNLSVPQIFISEYLEGSSNNKAIEIFNAGSEAVDLSKVTIRQSNNGIGFGNSPADSTYTLQLEGVLEPFKTYTIVNGQAAQIYLDKADLIKSFGNNRGDRVVAFNGDDAMGLFYEDQLIDLIGDPNSDPGSSWAIPGGATANFTLVRKQGFKGNSAPLASFGTSEENSEWIVFAQDYSDDLSRHSFRMDSKVAFLFEVNMQTQLLRGAFQPSERGDQAQLRGNFDGWGTGIVLESDPNNNNVYSTYLQNENYQWGDNIPYKFVFVNGQTGAINWETGENKLIFAENRRYFEDERTEDGFIVYRVKDPIPYFDGIAPDGVFTEESTVTFRVDLRPAYYFLEDRGFLPNSPDLVNIDGLWANGPLLNIENGWETWGEPLTQRSDLQFFDDGTHGDEIIGDSVFTLVYTFPVGAVKKGAVVLGINGYPNDTDAYVDRILAVEKDEVVDIIFGAFINDDGNAVVSHYGEYIEQIDDQLVVVRGDFFGIPQNASFLPDKYNAVGGELVNIPMYVGTLANPVQKLLFYRVDFRFDQTRLEFISFEFGQDLGESAQSYVYTDAVNDGTVDFVQFGEDESKTGIYYFGTATFRVLENAEPGLVEFSANRLIGSNFDGQSFKFIPEFGSILIQDKQTTKAQIWPGDTNRDGIVSEIDVLPLGQYFGLTGPARSAIDITWEAKEADFWEVPSATYVDANGDGQILATDLEAIDQNFDEIIPIITKKTFDSLMNVEIPIPAVKKGDHVRIAIDAGSEQNPIQGLLGAAIRLIAPPQYLNLAEFIPSEFLASQNLIPFIHYNEQTFELSLALTRTRLDGGVNGFGKIAELEFVATETIPEGFKINLVSAVISSESGLNYSPSLGVEVAITTNVENVQNIPTEFSLSQNYPNPFNPSTQISFDVPQNGMVSIQVFNMLGQQVATLLNRELNVGSHTVNFDASNLSSGMYLYSLKAGNVNITKKMMLIK